LLGLADQYFGVPFSAFFPTSSSHSGGDGTTTNSGGLYTVRVMAMLCIIVPLLGSASVTAIV
jgi:hypothetical protein